MKQNKETLKTYFETGDKPTQGQYRELIDSMWHKDERITTVKDGTIQINNVATKRNTKPLVNGIMLGIQVPQEKEVVIEAEIGISSKRRGFVNPSEPLNISAKVRFEFGYNTTDKGETFFTALNQPILRVEENDYRKEIANKNEPILKLGSYTIIGDTSKPMAGIELSPDIQMQIIEEGFAYLKNISITTKKDVILDEELWKNHDYLKLLSIDKIGDTKSSTDILSVNEYKLAQPAQVAYPINSTDIKEWDNKDTVVSHLKHSHPTSGYYQIDLPGGPSAEPKYVYLEAVFREGSSVATLQISGYLNTSGWVNLQVNKLGSSNINTEITFTDEAFSSSYYRPKVFIKTSSYTSAIIVRQLYYSGISSSSYSYIHPVKDLPLWHTQTITGRIKGTVNV